MQKREENTQEEDNKNNYVFMVIVAVVLLGICISFFSSSTKPAASKTTYKARKPKHSKTSSFKEEPIVGKVIAIDLGSSYTRLVNLFAVSYSKNVQ